MDTTRALVTFCLETRFDDLPAEVVDRAKRCILDALGCGIGGSQTELGTITYEVARELGGTPECTIIGFPTKTNCVEAAGANAAIINALDFDDCGPEGHPGSTTIASALAAAERAGASGREFLTAVVLGYEASCRVGMAMEPSWERLAELQGMPWQSLGGAVAGGRLLGLSLEQLLHAFGLAGATTAIPSAASREPRPLSWVKDNVAWQAAVALHAVLLARRGYIANTHILDRFWIKASSDRWLPERVTRELGQNYAVMEAGFKLFPCCYILHSALRALAELVERENVTAEQVESVVVRWPFYLPQRFLVHRPETYIDAEFSIPFASAMVLLRKPPTRWLDKANLRDPEVLKVADKVTAEMDTELSSIYKERLEKGGKRLPIPGGATLHTSDGRILQNQALAPWGYAGVRDDWGELGAKFQGLVRPVLGTKKAGRLESAIQHLEEIRDMAELTVLLRGPGG